MPEIAARSRLSATARIALPSRVRARKSATAGATTAAMASATAWPGRDPHEPEVVDGGLVDAVLRIRGPATRKMTFRSISPSPVVMSDSATRPRPRSGRSTAKWRPTASSAVAAIAPTVGDDDVLAEPHVQDQGDVGGERQVLPVGEVRDPLDAEDERGADAREGEDGAGDEAVQGQLERGRPASGQRPAGLAAAAAPGGPEERARPGRGREIAGRRRGL